MSDLQAAIDGFASAAEGSRELDALAAKALGWHYDEGSAMTLSGPSWMDADGNTQELPYFSTSLDAALPGENIYRIQRYGDQWLAWHEIQPGMSKGSMGNTEVLARRLARLKTMAA